jgi:uncharacterized membrane protein
MLLVSIFLLGFIDLGRAEIHADEPVDCIIIKRSACPDCVDKYNTYVDPFFIAYQMNETIDFAFIDVSTETTFFFEQMDEYDISVGDYGDFPWVIFIWGDEQVVVLDIEAIIVDNAITYTTLDAILEDIGYTPPDNNGTTPPSFDVIDFSVLAYAMAIVGGITLSAISGGVALDKYTDIELRRLRIDKNRLLLFGTLTFVSLIALTYQFLDYLRGGCGCATNDLAKTLLFRKHELYTIFGIKIPFALLGIFIMTAVLIQVLILGIIPLPLRIPLSKEKSLVFTNSYGEYWYYFIVFQLFLTIGGLFYLLYLELFVINFICILCTLSQIIIVINTVLIMTWNPFPKSVEEQI